MRSDEEIIDLILKIASQDERIRIVAMNGSRVNKNARQDAYQDFDIVFLVKDMQSFLKNKKWVDIFGKRLIMQTPEDAHLFPASLGGWYTYLMLFEDKNRIDLMLIPLKDLNKYLKNDKLIKILLDKDNLIKKLPTPSDETFWIKRPTEEQFQGSCNEFWWLVPYVIKGIKRDEIIYAQDHLSLLRKELLRQFAWKVGFENNFQVSVGKSYKFLRKFIEEKEFNKIVKTYSTADEMDCSKALNIMCELFREVARKVAQEGDFKYIKEEEKNIMNYLKEEL